MPSNSKIKTVLFGAGEVGKRVVDVIKMSNYSTAIECFVDNDSLKVGKEYRGVKIYSPEHILSLGDNVEIIITTHYQNEYAGQIISQLPDMGFRYGENVFTCIHKSDNHIAENYVRKEQIIGGMVSGDRMYCVEDDAGDHFFLRVADISRYEKLKAEFEVICEAHKHGIPVAHPVKFGTLNLQRGVYYAADWIDGKMLHYALPNFPRGEQYRLGEMVGENVKKIHSIPYHYEAVGVKHIWHSIDLDEILEKTLRLQNMNGSYLTETEKTSINFVEKNIHLAKTEPLCRLHGDINLWNIMLDKHCNLKIVDFNDTYIGVPWREFCWISEIAQISAHFAMGLLHGYFEGDPTDEDWVQISFYIALRTALSMKPQHSSFMREVLLNLNKRALWGWGNMENLKPDWYIQNKHKGDNS